MKNTALIMAGGRGERFWPRSRKDLPKQFLSLTGDGKTMIQLTVERILPIVAMEDIYIATNKSYEALVKEQLPGIPAENILCEPAGRNTAPCIGLGAMHISRKYDDAVMMVLPSDHLLTGWWKSPAWSLPTNTWPPAATFGTAACSYGKYPLFSPIYASICLIYMKD